MRYLQENINGNLLQLSVVPQMTDHGTCEEYVAEYNGKREQFAIIWLVALSTTVFLVSFCFVLHVLQVTVLCTITLVSLAHFAFKVIEEHVMFLPRVGLQQTVVYACGLSSSHFIDYPQITDVIINENIGWTHYFYLAVILKNPSKKHKLFPLFQIIDKDGCAIKEIESSETRFPTNQQRDLVVHTTPRLAFLQEVYVSMQKLAESHLVPLNMEND